MPKTLDEPPVAKTPTGAKVVPTKTVAVPVRKPTPYVRWMAWMLGLTLVVAAVGAIAYVIDDGSSTMTAPALSDIDPRESPEAFRTPYTPIMAPAISELDPHVSPEIVRDVYIVGSAVAPGLTGIDPRVSPEAFRAPFVIVPVAASLSDIDPHISPEAFRELYVVGTLVAPSLDDIDPHESPEARRGS